MTDRLPHARRPWLVVMMTGAIILAAIPLGLPSIDLIDRWPAIREVLGGLIRPTLTYESQVPTDAPPLLVHLLMAAANTVVYAGAGLGLALLVGPVLGIFGSRTVMRQCPRVMAPLFVVTRLFSASVRSTHELIWAVLFLAALGLSPIAAACAIAIPFAGTFGKIFAEQMDEVSDQAGSVLRAAGATVGQTVVLTTIPAAFPVMLSYIFYRFECAVRAAAIMGFFGVPTLGADIALAFAESQYREMSTALFMLIGVSIVVEWISSLMRARLSP